jgi:hypothetical protein
MGRVKYPISPLYRQLHYFRVGRRSGAIPKASMIASENRWLFHFAQLGEAASRACVQTGTLFSLKPQKIGKSHFT